MKKIFICGAGGHGLVVADIARSIGYEDIVFVDDAKEKYLCYDDIKEHNKTDIVVAIGDNNIRKKVFKQLVTDGFNIVTLIHPGAVISQSVFIGKGTVVMPGVVINANTQIGDGVILNSSCVVEHENIIEDFVHISPNASLAGNVKIGEMTHIGIGSSIIQNIDIGNNSIIGAGSVVLNDINDFKVAYGVPAKVQKDLIE